MAGNAYACPSCGDGVEWGRQHRCLPALPRPGRTCLDCDAPAYKPHRPGCPVWQHLPAHWLDLQIGLDNV